MIIAKPNARYLAPAGGLLLFATAASALVAIGSSTGTASDPFLVLLPSSPPSAVTQSQSGGGATASLTEPPPAGGDAPAPRLPLADLVYFGDAWTALEIKAPSPYFVMGDGYRVVSTTRDPLDGTAIVLVVEKANSAGQITDVILSYTGTQHPSLDTVTDIAIQLGLDDPQLDAARDLFDSIVANPRYANAHIHLTGHSMGGAIGIWLFAHSLSHYGREFTHDRVSATVFGTPPWSDGPLQYFDVDAADFAGYVHEYAPSNDIIAQGPGGAHLGTRHILAEFLPFGHNPVGQALALSVGHHQVGVLQGLGLPAWMTDAQRLAINEAVASTNGLRTWDPEYGATGTVARQVIGTAGSEWIEGGDSPDRIEGGKGADTLAGGLGGDRFIFKAEDSLWDKMDLIRDFNGAAGDRIDLLQMDAIPGNWTRDAFRFIGRSRPTAIGEVGYDWTGQDTLVFVRTSASAPELVIRLKGRFYLGASDFLL